jgi:hypothetical protein
MHIFIKISYLFIKYFKIVFFNKKICERSGTIWNDLERYGTFVNVLLSGTFVERSAREVMNDRTCKMNLEYL